MRNIFLIAGARPNFMKIAPLHRALTSRGVACTLVHTGQHYDQNMSDVFFKQLNIPAPDINLGIGAGDRIEQSHRVMKQLVPLLEEKRPDAVLVVGDVTSTAAAAMAGCMAGIPVIHVEAGLRSGNLKMPEEHNRMIADHLSQFCFVTEPVGMKNLRFEGISESRAFFVGNVMIDTLRNVETLLSPTLLDTYGVKPSEYAVLTMHRPETVDDEALLRLMCETLGEIGRKTKIIFPMHHRMRMKLDEFNIPFPEHIMILEPVGYIEMLTLVKHAKYVLTDSGGLQEETTIFGVPCVTMRDQTERPITCEVGTSEIVGRDPAKIHDAVNRILSGKWKTGRIPDLWDGRAAERIADILHNA